MRGNGNSKTVALDISFRGDDHGRDRRKSGNPIQLVDGNVAIDVARPSGETSRGRRIAMHNVVVEMGFLHPATVPAEGPAVPCTLTRAIVERFRRGRPDLTNAFDDVAIGILTGRIDHQASEVAALEPPAS